MADREGRPLKFESVEILQKKIDKYFADCDKHTTKMADKEGNIIKVPDPKPYTISGLAYALDTSRETLINYENRPEYFDTIRKAKDKCEVYAEESLWKPKVASGVIFNLSNNYSKWKIKQEVDANLSGGLDNTNININTDPDQLRKEIDEMIQRRNESKNGNS